MLSKAGTRPTGNISERANKLEFERLRLESLVVSIEYYSSRSVKWHWSMLYCQWQVHDNQQKTTSKKHCP